jgi:hypothetical protein
MVPGHALYVIAPGRDCSTIRSCLGGLARVIAEDEFIPGMQAEQLRRLAVRGFPSGAGWYFQQLLKLQFAFVEQEEDFYLIWDADTVPLRPLRFFDSSGKMLLTKATEYHPPYFETYRRLLGEEPNREFSFIAQHIVVQKSIAREMLGRIEQQVAVAGNWAWKIMKSLPSTGDNLFSEYETYGHYVKNHFPERVEFVERPWLRNGTRWTKGRIPTAKDLALLARDFDFVAFERMDQGWRRVARSLLSRFHKHHF